MFEDIGKKIKNLCKVVFYVLSACAVIGGLIAFISPILAENAEIELILLGFVLMIAISALGVFVAWLIVMLLYAFGELVDLNQKQVNQNRKIISILLNKELKDGEDEEYESKSVNFFENNAIDLLNEKNKER